MRRTRVSGWARGANNRAASTALPEGFARDLVNLDARPDGTMALRPGQRKIYDGEAVTLAAAYGGGVVVVDGAELLRISRSGARETLGAVNPGPAAAAVHNDELFLSCGLQALRYDGRSLVEWGCDRPHARVSIGAGGALVAGVYKIAVTRDDPRSGESGAEVMGVSLSGGEALAVTVTEPVYLYLTAPNGKTLYRQAQLAPGTHTITSVTDDGERLSTAHKCRPPAGHIVASCGARLAIAEGNVLWLTEPFVPHLVDPIAGFFQYPARITNAIPVEGGLFVTADKTYYLSALDSEAPAQATVANIGAIEGTGVELPDGTAAWFGEYGLTLGAPGGAISWPHRETYTSNNAVAGAAGYVDRSGVRAVVASLNRGVTHSAAGTQDYCDLEIERL